MTVTSGLMLAAILGGIVLYGRIGVMDSNITNIEGKIDELNKKSNEYLTKSEADDRAKMRDLEMKQFESQLDQVKNQVSSLENAEKSRK